ncbi:MAG: hypothetical protein HY059_09360 [Proteobacteria bacterium]|nr:hypothetical protein [Pseudomonadota bacterium]
MANKVATYGLLALAATALFGGRGYAAPQIDFKAFNAAREVRKAEFRITRGGITFSYESEAARAEILEMMNERKIRIDGNTSQIRSGEGAGQLIATYDPKVGGEMRLRLKDAGLPGGPSLILSQSNKDGTAFKFNTQPEFSHSQLIF